MNQWSSNHAAKQWATPWVSVRAAFTASESGSAPSPARPSGGAQFVLAFQFDDCEAPASDPSLGPRQAQADSHRILGGAERQFCAKFTITLQRAAAAQNGGTVHVLRGFLWSLNVLPSAVLSTKAVHAALLED
jgi:hypothetical protein